MDSFNIECQCKVRDAANNAIGRKKKETNDLIDAKMVKIWKRRNTNEITQLIDELLLRFEPEEIKCSAEDVSEWIGLLRMVLMWSLWMN